MAARRKSSPRRRAAYLPWAITGAVILAFIILLVALARQPRTSRVGGQLMPRVGDHWHARFSIETCGNTLPPLPPSPGDVHTHGDGIIHVHPASPATAGRRASLDAFLRSAKVEVTESALKVPGGPAYANGDKCPDGRPGRVRVNLRRVEQAEFRPLADFSRYIPQDGDQIRVVFGP